MKFDGCSFFLSPKGRYIISNGGTIYKTDKKNSILPINHLANNNDIQAISFCDDDQCLVYQDFAGELYYTNISTNEGYKLNVANNDQHILDYRVVNNNICIYATFSYEGECFLKTLSLNNNSIISSFKLKSEKIGSIQILYKDSIIYLLLQVEANNQLGWSTKLSIINETDGEISIQPVNCFDNKILYSADNAIFDNEMFLADRFPVDSKFLYKYDFEKRTLYSELQLELCSLICNNFCIDNTRSHCCFYGENSIELFDLIKHEKVGCYVLSSQCCAALLNDSILYSFSNKFFESSLETFIQKHQPKPRNEKKFNIVNTIAKTVFSQSAIQRGDSIISNNSSEIVLEQAYDIISGKSADSLTEKEYEFYIMYEFYTEYENGGTAQYFYNSSKTNAQKLIAVLKKNSMDKLAIKLESVINQISRLSISPEIDFVSFSRIASFDDTDTKCQSVINGGLLNLLIKIACDILAENK